MRGKFLQKVIAYYDLVSPEVSVMPGLPMTKSGGFPHPQEAMPEESRGANPRVLYHGTDKKNLPSIQKIGILPVKSASSLDAVFLTDDVYTAKNYGCMHGSPAGWTILEIDISKLDASKFGPDNYELQDKLDSMTRPPYENWNDVPWQKSLKLCNQCAYYGTIPPKAIIGTVK